MMTIGRPDLASPPEQARRRRDQLGIRFRCHHCEKQLHVKDFQAGKRGKCPKCKASFRIPKHDADYSLSLEPAGQEMVGAASHASSDSQSFSHKASADIDDALGLDAASTFEAPNELPESLTEQEQTEPLRMQPAENEWAREASPPEEPTRKQPTAPAFWYVRPPSGGQFGPADQEVFDQWLTENRVTADSLVWRDGWEEWMPAAEAMPEAFPGLQNGSSKSPARLEPVSTGSESSQPSLGERNRLERKQKRKRNYKVMLGVLIVLTLVLLSALIVAILNQ